MSLISTGNVTNSNVTTPSTSDATNSNVTTPPISDVTNSNVTTPPTSLLLTTPPTSDGTNRFSIRSHTLYYDVTNPSMMSLIDLIKSIIIPSLTPDINTLANPGY